MPDGRILERKAYKGDMRGPVTVELYQAMEQALKRKEQVILLYNRRGYASFLRCEECGHVPQSPESSTSLTYHKRKNILLDQDRKSTRLNSSHVAISYAVFCLK